MLVYNLFNNIQEDDLQVIVDFHLKTKATPPPAPSLFYRVRPAGSGGLWPSSISEAAVPGQRLAGILAVPR